MDIKSLDWTVDLDVSVEVASSDKLGSAQRIKQAAMNAAWAAATAVCASTLPTEGSVDETTTRFSQSCELQVEGCYLQYDLTAEFGGEVQGSVMVGAFDMVHQVVVQAMLQEVQLSASLLGFDGDSPETSPLFNYLEGLERKGDCS